MPTGVLPRGVLPKVLEAMVDSFLKAHAGTVPRTQRKPSNRNQQSYTYIAMQKPLVRQKSEINIIYRNWRVKKKKKKEET